MKRLLLALAVVLAASASCRGEPKPLTPNQYVTQRAEIECAAISAACLMPASTCMVGRQTQHATEYQNAIGSFREFIPDNAEACLDKVGDVYGKLNQGAVALLGSEYLAMQAVCASVYRGAKAAYEACTSTLDCETPLICDKGLCGAAKLVAPGAGCANIGEYCPPGSYCSSTATTGVWFCSAKVGAQGHCDDATPCLESLRCSANVCAARLEIALPCATDGDCASGFCEPYALKCANDIRFASGTPACSAMGG
jgi:hypothetical protein